MALRGRGAKWGGALPKLRILCPKAFFVPKWPQNPFKTAKRRETVATLHMCLDFPMTKSSFLPWNSTICSRNGPKMAKKGRMCVVVSNRPKTQNGPYLELCGSNPISEGTWCTRNPPLFVVFEASATPKETPRPPYQWSLGGGERWVH